MVSIVFIVTVFPILLTACSMPVTKVDVQSFEIKKTGIKSKQALSTLTGIFLDRGYDIKFTNLDAGVMTTEYKKFASSGSAPPFYYYMQIRARVKIKRGESIINLSPMVKEQNRSNAAAYTEHELSYYTGDLQNIRLISSMRETVGWRILAQIQFMNIVSDTADQFGIAEEDVIQNVTKTPANAFGAK